MLGDEAMNKTVEKFIKELKTELKDVNEDRIYDKDFKQIDIPFVVSVVEQQIHNCEEFIKNITEHSFIVNGYEEDNNDGYTNGRIRILIEKKEDEKKSEYMFDAFENYCYYIEFLIDERYCSYDDRWDASAFRLIKETDMYSGKWEGTYEDYKKYKNEFEKDESNRSKLLEDAKKEEEIRRIHEQINELNDRLSKLRS